MNVSHAVSRLVLTPSILGVATVSFVLAGSNQDLERAFRTLLEARAAMGLTEPAWESGRLVLEGRGTLDYDARDQGMAPGEPHVVSNEETLGFDFESGRAAYEYRQPRADGSVRWRREDYVEPGKLLYVGLTGRWAELTQSPEAAAGRLRISRRLPQNLVREAIERRASLQWLGRVENLHRLSYSLPDGTPVSIGFDAETHLLRTLELLEDHPLRGDVVIRWEFSDYRPVERFGPIAHRYRILIGADVFVDVHVRPVDAEHTTTHPIFRLPDDIPMPPLRTPSGPSRRAEPELIEVKPGIFFVKNVRAGLNAFFADMGDFVLAYDAPADYRLIDEIPPGRLAPGSTSNSVTEDLLRLVAGALPDKPVRYAVISHYHSDHLGGVRAYLRSGTEVVVPAGIGQLVARVARAPHRIAEGSDERSFHDLAVTEVSEQRVIEGASRTARIRFIGNAPHARAMLVVEFPLDRLMFTGDLFYPNPLNRFPNPNREPIMRFFVEWLDRNELAPEIVLGSHATVPGTGEHLAVIRRRAQ